jgi:protein-S-isoprenylcysteine O-methyltransferase Ste14
MRPLIVTWPDGLFFWTVFVWALTPESRIVTRPAEPSASAQDAGSKRLIVVGQGLAMLAAFTIAPFVPSAAMAHRTWLFWAGITAMVGGSLLRRHCFRQLGASFTGDVIVRPDQAVIERGAYRYVRHPSYTAGAILFLGLGLALANWLSLAVVMVTVAGVYGYRVIVEERALETTIGDPYRSYMRRTTRFVPFIF